MHENITKSSNMRNCISNFLMYCWQDEIIKLTEHFNSKIDTRINHYPTLTFIQTHSFIKILHLLNCTLILKTIVKHCVITFVLINVKCFQFKFFFLFFHFCGTKTCKAYNVDSMA